MSEHKHANGESEMPRVSAQAAEPEFYEEPPRMTAADVAGVIVALLALAVIGFGGYIWLNPDLDLADLQARFAHKPVISTQTAQVDVPRADRAVAPTAQQPDAVQAEPLAAAEPPVSAEAETLDSSCPFCGMFTDNTLGLVVANWSDGTSTHHDSWACAHNYQTEQALTLSSATVLDYSSGLASRSELDAKAASYLFGINKLDGSMPPFVAAFSDKAGAEEAQRELGGELVDFAGLQGKLP